MRIGTDSAHSIETPRTGFVRSWNHFWFHPADPITLGFLRICCGILVVYVHLMYTFDLQDLVGPHAWVDIQTINERRHDYPTLTPPETWDDPRIRKDLKPLLELPAEQQERALL